MCHQKPSSPSSFLSPKKTHIMNPQKSMDIHIDEDELHRWPTPTEVVEDIEAIRRIAGPTTLTGRPAPRAAPRRPVQNPPQAATRAAPPETAQPQSGSLMGSIGSTIAQGLAFGGGSAVAQRAVDSIMGPRTIQVENTGPEATSASLSAMGNAAGSDSCNIHNQAFQDGLQSTMFQRPCC